MSIVTLWFTADAHAMIVKVDILEEFKLGFKKATFLPEGDVEYFTRQVTPEGEYSTVADDREWEQVERFLHFANNYKKRVRAYRKMLLTREMLALNTVMGDLYSGMLRNAAAAEAQDQQLRRILTPR